ncbi:MAG: DNA alkylation repair protein [Flavipsychrobacter sp.]
MTVENIVDELKKYGNDATKKVFKNHGAQEPMYGVKVGDLKKIQKKIKKDHELSIALFDTGISDAMYLASLIADEEKITKAQLKKWAKKANWHMLSEYAVPWIAAESRYGWELALEWIEAKDEKLVATGWATMSSVLSIKQDEEIDLKIIKQLLKKAEKEVHNGQNRVSYAMNSFIISVGGYVQSLTDEALKAAKKIGKVKVEMNGTSCKVPLADEYIEKMQAKGVIGKKRKMARC